MAWDIGDTVTVSLTVENSAGALADPTTVALTVVDPSGVSTTPPVTRDGVGLYHVDITPNASGTWRYRWVTTGTVGAASDGQFDVRVPVPASTPALFTDDELAAYLQVDTVAAATADLLRVLATAAIEAEAGKSFNPVPGTVKGVAIAAAARAYTNPEGLTSETIGRYAPQHGADTRVGVYLTAEEKRTVRAAANSARTGLGTIDVTRGGATGTYYVEAVTDGQPVPDPGSAASWPLPFGG